MGELHWLAVLVTALSSFVLGGLWYSNALFGNAWRREAGDTRPRGEGHPGKVFGTSFAFALIAAVAYAWLVPAPAGADGALRQGLLAGAGTVAASFGINYQFAGRSTKLWLIDGGYHTVQFVLYGLIIGLWR
jgi:Protein of unknown function (DUF1761)